MSERERVLAEALQEAVDIIEGRPRRSPFVAVDDWKAALALCKAAPPEELTEEEQALIRSGRKIQALKEYRWRVQTDLLTAKNRVERFASAGKP